MNNSIYWFWLINDYQVATAIKIKGVVNIEVAAVDRLFNKVRVLEKCCFMTIYDCYEPLKEQLVTIKHVKPSLTKNFPLKLTITNHKPMKASSPKHCDCPSFSRSTGQPSQANFWRYSVAAGG